MVCNIWLMEKIILWWFSVWEVSFLIGGVCSLLVFKYFERCPCMVDCVYIYYIDLQKIGKFIISCSILITAGTHAVFKIDVRFM